MSSVSRHADLRTGWLQFNAHKVAYPSLHAATDISGLTMDPIACAVQHLLCIGDLQGIPSHPRSHFLDVNGETFKGSHSTGSWHNSVDLAGRHIPLFTRVTLAPLRLVACKSPTSISVNLPFILFLFTGGPQRFSYLVPEHNTGTAKPSDRQQMKRFALSGCGLPLQWTAAVRRDRSTPRGDNNGEIRVTGGHGGRVVSLLASHQGDPGSIPDRDTPDFRMWESCRIMQLVGGFSRGSPVSPAFSFRHCSILTSIALIGSQDLDVKSRPNLFTHPTKSRAKWHSGKPCDSHSGGPEFDFRSSHRDFGYPGFSEISPANAAMLPQLYSEAVHGSLSAMRQILSQRFDESWRTLADLMQPMVFPV
ncbi:hypothetical protein PR048_028949 [Dryococelus australis]|uniref:Uncharacterized protein n=1 Tax=Dryococelus australis TaxID=614101 RepID=A0ABQ9GEQ8_9NEOP|nr:hypothetical protein PR048_028949 [Dryococelus australis]